MTNKPLNKFMLYLLWLSGIVEGVLIYILIDRFLEGFTTMSTVPYMIAAAVIHVAARSITDNLNKQ